MASSSIEYFGSSLFLFSFLPKETTAPLVRPRLVSPLGKSPAKIRLVPTTRATRGMKSKPSKAPSPMKTKKKQNYIEKEREESIEGHVTYENKMRES